MTENCSQSPRRVFGVIGEPMTGVSYARFIQPFDHLRAFGYQLETLGHELKLRPIPGASRIYGPDPDLLDGCSLLVFPQMVTSPRLAGGRAVDLVGPLCDQAKRRGIPMVYSVDDHLQLIEDHNPSHDRIRQSLGNLATILDAADAIIVTTEELRATLSDRGKPIHVLPNAVDPQRWRLRPRAGALRVGWAGSASHLDDLLLLAPAIRHLQRRVDCLLVLQGLTDVPFDEQVRQIKRRRRRDFSPSQRETAERFMALMGELRDIRYHHTPFVATERYFELLPALDLDVGVCPLVDTPFNRHKSAIKFYEYAMVGTMTVASHVRPYEDEVSVTVPNTTADWAETLERYLIHPTDRENALAQQRDYVLTHRTIQRLLHRWHAALTEIIGEPAREPLEVAR